AGAGRGRGAGEAGGGQWYRALHARIKPDEACPADMRLIRDAEEREAQAVQRMSRIDDLNSINGDVREPNRGIVLVGCGRTPPGRRTAVRPRRTGRRPTRGRTTGPAWRPGGGRNCPPARGPRSNG